jgi:succinate dehydrogenase / fumarate reductase cytochrome b subunit
MSMKKVAYYAGCLASLSAKELDSSTRALAPQLDIELLDMPNATCCGAGDIAEAKPDFYLHVNARVLSQAEQMGVDTIMTVCNVCTMNLRQANLRMSEDEDLRERVNANLKEAGVEPYNGTVDVQHFLWMITTGDRYEMLKKVAGGRLSGMKVAPFYGCQILRPSKVLGFEDPDSPQSLERIIRACGAEPIDYPAKLKCCGFPIVLAREEVALNEVTQPLQQASERGADCIVTPCPLCHLSLDAWQSKAEKQAGVSFNMPTLHMSQLIGVAAGLPQAELKFQRHITKVGEKIMNATVR